MKNIPLDCINSRMKSLLPQIMKSINHIQALVLMKRTEQQNTYSHSNHLHYHFTSFTISIATYNIIHHSILPYLLFVLMYIALLEFKSMAKNVLPPQESTSAKVVEIHRMNKIFVCMRTCKTASMGVCWASRMPTFSPHTNITHMSNSHTIHNNSHSFPANHHRIHVLYSWFIISVFLSF